MAEQYFLLIDRDKNTLLIPCRESAISEIIGKIGKDKIVTHATKGELIADITAYLKEGGKNNNG